MTLLTMRIDSLLAHHRFTRRRFLRLSATSAAAALLSACTDGTRPRFGRPARGVETRWPIKRVVYLMLENRSFDNVFGGFPGANGSQVGVNGGVESPLIRCPQWLPGDLSHDRFASEDHINGGAMDGFATGRFGDPYAFSQLSPEDIPNYHHWARTNVLCDNFFASALGASHPQHLFFIAGTSGGAIDNPENTQTLFKDGESYKSWGIDAYGDDMYVWVMDERGDMTKHSTTFDLPTYGAELSKKDIDWAFYGPEPHQAGYMWIGYNAIPEVFNSELWDEHIWPVDDLLVDIQASALPAVTWIVPRFARSDHPPFSSCHSHNWVTDIVNGIMRSDMWEETAIFITWDEWGGFYDHVVPPVWDHVGAGIRVPMLVISPYAKRGYVDDAEGEFSSPLKFIADNWDLPYLTDRVERTHNFEHVFDFDQRPRPPDPRPRNPNCYGTVAEFPEAYPDWLPGITPEPPALETS